MTVGAVGLCVILLFFEVAAFLTDTVHTKIVIDTNQDSMLQINFDVSMLDIACDYVTVGAWDAFGTERMNLTRNVQKQRIDHKGTRKGQPYTEDELLELEFADLSYTKEELQALDSDWSSSSDQFRHDSFQAVVDAHDFTFVNFYAEWCPHCQVFSPKWAEFEDEVNTGKDLMKDADQVPANVRALKMNCVDFEETCRDQHVRGFPTVRLFLRSLNQKGKNWVDYTGPRNKKDLSAFAHEQVAKRHLHTGATHHSMFKEGCRLSGYVEVARVPGTLHFQARHTQEKTLNLAFTNVSHTVHHFSFGQAPRRSIAQLPNEYKRHVNPLDGKTFTVDRFHQAPNHFIKVVHTRFEGSGLRSYQQTHQSSVRTLDRDYVPQAKFSYDLSPVEVVVSRGERTWYTFLTQTFANIGGAFAVVSMAAGLMRTTAKQLTSILLQK